MVNSKWVSPPLWRPLDEGFFLCSLYTQHCSTELQTVCVCLRNRPRSFPQTGWSMTRWAEATGWPVSAAAPCWLPSLWPFSEAVPSYPALPCRNLLHRKPLVNKRSHDCFLPEYFLITNRANAAPTFCLSLYSLKRSFVLIVKQEAVTV